ncbi:hypothetical protein [Pseudochrobactrum kiredjianiae]|uniref:Uncharacterized protein n=1 Tax=Pseudochrobactrum kiredjianiae TaxID=386305 RepID=A0ABW3V9Z0_9HYPH|nr:hypothetical protein [Pseudochrobactrum kiredjianiae]MDM7850319.1 hypothetical protein [Pseudochrobactrum kiredjianiae]
MAIVPDLLQIKATVERMEKRYSAQNGDVAQVLWAAYVKVKVRFETDLSDERDIWLSRAAALMLLKYQLEVSK